VQRLGRSPADAVLRPKLETTMSAATVEIEVAGRRVAVSNLDKVLYPAAGFTKRDVIEYYTRISPVMLPHLSGRAVTLKRFPQGVGGPFFYEKRCPSHRPDWVKTQGVEGREDCIHYCTIEDLPTIVWLANLADLELHTFLALARDLDRPTAMVFDLDPGPPANLVQCCEVALRMREACAGLGLKVFAKTSGSKGLHLGVPLNTAVTFADTHPFAHRLAQQLEEADPALIVSRMTRSLRTGKVLIDWSQNDRHKTTVGVYSLRAKERPTVSTPVSWEEIERCAREGKPELLSFAPEDVLRRVEAFGDLFAPMLELKQRLPAKRRSARGAKAAS
jgi:bifunctional non-homologous end joining protein LigD